MNTNSPSFFWAEIKNESKYLTENTFPIFGKNSTILVKFLGKFRKQYF